MRSTRWTCGLLLLAHAGAPAALDEAEQRARIEFETKQFEAQIEQSELLFHDPELDAYLQEVTDRMFPDMKGKLRVRTFKDPEFNAFAVVTGGIYFNTGTLLRLDDEAQLASVLGHEGTHVTADHMYRSIRSQKSGSALTLLGGVVAASYGIPPDLVGIVGVSSMAGFSRAHERESDQGGFERMVAAGYDPRGGAEAFARLERELAARQIKEGAYFFASHPNVKDRVETLTEFAGPAPEPGERNADRYRAATLRARRNALDQVHRSGDGRALVFLLEHEELLPTLPPEARFYLAEGYRLRAEHPRRDSKDKRSEAEVEAQRTADRARAIEEYERTIAEAPEFAPPLQALAFQLYRDGDKPRALDLFRRYLALVPDPKQSGYAREYVELLTQELEP